jgi:uncharacterized metal-binding protein YceD (DUF177 family)
MKIELNSITERSTIEISGDESWLEPIYQDYAAPSGISIGKLKGKVTVEPVGDRIVSVAVDCTFGPYVDCGRCNDRIPWPINLKSTVYFQDAPEFLQRKIDYKLSRGELDEYYFEDDAIDVQGLLIDHIAMAFPSSTVDSSPDGSSCQVCGISLLTEQVFGEPESSKPNPFSVLKNIKLPKS